MIESFVSLTILGTQSPYAKQNNACPSFLLSDNKHKLLLDCGSGSHRFFDMKNLENLGIIISHFHKDHFNDIYNYMYSAYVLKNQGKLNNPIQLFLPSEPVSVFNQLKNENLTFSVANRIENKNYSFGNFSFEFLKVQHSEEILSYAIKVKINSKTVVYTGDISYKSKNEIVEFAKNADILICESSLLESYGFEPNCNHLTAKQAGEIAKQAKVKKLILTHFWPEENVENYLNEAKQVFECVYIAKENEKFDL